MIRLLLCLFLVSSLAGCDTNEAQDQFFLESELFPEGYTRTNAAGEVIDADPADWQVAPAFRGSVEVQPLFPNPVGRGDIVTVTITDSFGDAIIGGVYARGRIDNDPNQAIRLDVDDSAGPVYVLTFNPTSLRISADDRSELFRIRIFTQDFRLITYGDVLVQ